MGEEAVQKLSAFNKLSAGREKNPNQDCVYVTVPHPAPARLCSSLSLALFQDVDTIYHSQDNREFNLLDFSHLDSR